MDTPPGDESPTEPQSGVEAEDPGRTSVALEAQALKAIDRAMPCVGPGKASVASEAQAIDRATPCVDPGKASVASEAQAIDRATPCVDPGKRSEPSEAQALEAIDRATPWVDPGKRSEPSEAQVLKAIDRAMPCVGPGLYISGVNGVMSLRMLKSKRITHILNLAEELMDAPFPEGFTLRHQRLRDADNENILDKFPELVEYIQEVVSGGGHIVVSCVAGVSRSASLCLAYKVRHQGLSLREAYHQVHQARPVIAPNPGFWQALITWEEQVRGENSVLMRPYICGMVPELETYDRLARTRIYLGWREELIITWSFHLLLFCLQLISILCDR
ncbi:hypothetical protein ACOMHN_006824 [Nucella lapillus]